MGNPVERVDYSQPHRLAVSFASLYPPGSPLNKSQRIRVTPLTARPCLSGDIPLPPVQSRADSGSARELDRRIDPAGPDSARDRS